MTISSLRWPLLGLLGLLVAGAIAFLATQMVSQKIGISSEPPTAGLALAPRLPASKKPGHARPTAPPRPPTAPPTPTTTSATAIPSAPSDGRGEGRDD